MPHHVRRYTGIFAHAGLQRAREQAHAAAARRAAKLLEAQGRGGDRHLIHVSDKELAAIRNSFGPKGHAGRRNPITGLESFAPEDDASAESGIADDFGDQYAVGGPSQSAAFNVLRSILPTGLSSPPHGSAASFIGLDQPFPGRDDTQIDPYQLAQSFIPLFARPPILPPRILRPLEELPRGSSGGEGAGKRFSDQIGDEPGTPCTYCTRPTTEEPGPDKLHRDHVQPRSQGGNNSRENYAPACQTCNLQKGPRTPEQWYKSIGKANDGTLDDVGENHD
jgi:hypothetical protein